MASWVGDTVTEAEPALIHAGLLQRADAGTCASQEQSAAAPRAQGADAVGGSAGANGAHAAQATPARASQQLGDAPAPSGGAAPSFSTLSPSPFPHAAARQHGATPRADPHVTGLAYNPLYSAEAPTPDLAKGLQHSELSPPSLVTAQAQSSRDAQPPALQAYLALLRQLHAKLQPGFGPATASSAVPGTVAGSSDAAGADSPQDTVPHSYAGALRQAVDAQEQQLLALCAQLTGPVRQDRAEVPRSTSGGLDIMQSLGSSFGGTPRSSDSHSGMATLSHAVAALIDAHKRQLRSMHKHITAAAPSSHSESASAHQPVTNAQQDAAESKTASAGAQQSAAWSTAGVAALKQGLQDMAKQAEDVQQELAKLVEVTRQQELEMSIQWSEKQQVQQAAQQQLAAVQQVQLRSVLLALGWESALWIFTT